MNIGHFLYDYLVMKGMSETSAKYLNMLVLLASLLVISFLVHFIIRKNYNGVIHEVCSKN